MKIQPHKLPDGRVIAEQEFYPWVMRYINWLSECDDKFLKLQRPIYPPHESDMTRAIENALPPILPNGFDSIKELKPTDAAYILRRIIGSPKEYLRTVEEILEPYAKRNPAIAVMLGVIKERVNALFDVAKEAPFKVLKATDLEVLLDKEKTKAMENLPCANYLREYIPKPF